VRHGLALAPGMAEEYTGQATESFRRACAPLLAECGRGIDGAVLWLAHLRKGRVRAMLGIWKKGRLMDQCKVVAERREALEVVLKEFLEDKRLVLVISY
jgi:hypothetical protein